MKLAVMQPYFFPYLGYFQLLNSVDTFIVYDNIKYTKSGWINRNRFLQNGKDVYFSVSLKKDSDSLDIRDRVISPEFNRSKLLNQIKEAYRKAPYFSAAFPIFEGAVLYNESNLFQYILFSMKRIAAYLNIKTDIMVSSTVNINHGLKAQDKIIALCKQLGAETYINAIGGKELYSKEFFKEQGIELRFIRPQPIEYKQFNRPFVPWLSILDVMMFNSAEEIAVLLDKFELL